MKITMVCDVLGQANNGTTLASYNLINKLKSSGHQVKVLCCDELKIGEEGYYVLKHFNFGPFNGYVKRNGVAVAKVDEKTLEDACGDADLIHIMLPFSAGAAAARYAHEHNIPLSAGFHCQAENITSHFFLKNIEFANNRAYRIMWNRVYRYCDAIHYPTEFIRKYCADRGYDQGAKSYVISNGVQTELFYPRQVRKKAYLKNKFVVLMSGRLVKEKQQIKLLKAIKKCVHEENIQVLLTGDGPRRKRLLTWGYKHLTNCPIIRQFPHEELADILCQADLYVHSSEVEIEAISCLEAIACGVVPLIANSPKSATSKFALHPSNSYKCKDINDLAKKIDYWYEHPDERNEVKLGYSEYVKQFDFKRSMERMNEMVLEVIKNGKIEKPWLEKKKKK